MSFSSPDYIWQTVESLLDADRIRAINRTRINELFNGDQPYTEQEASDNYIFTNVNFLEGTQIIHRARTQFENAFLKPENFFTVSLDFGPPRKRKEWGRVITRRINKMMKRRPRYYNCLESQFAAVVLHGVAPVLWYRDYDWCPKPYGIEDVLVPSGTMVDMENLDYFAVYQTYTAAQLLQSTSGESVDAGWNKQLVAQVLAKLNERLEVPGGGDTAPDLFQFPEKMAEHWKGNLGYLAGDAVPVVRAYDFYYRDTSEKDPVWKRKIILDRQGDDLGVAQNGKGVLYENPRLNYGDKIEHIMHVQFADGSVVSPFRWHSVRSLGYQLYAVCQLLNRIRCKLSDAVFESMMWYFRNDPSGDGELPEKVDLHDRGLIPNNLRWVLPNERHQVDFNLVGGAVGLYRELMQEHASSYVRDVESGNKSEPETATAIMAKVNQSSQLIGAMLSRAYTYQTYQYQEIVRRACTISNKECEKFRMLCIQDGVDPRVFEAHEEWDIIPERVLGAGNKMLEVAQADRLMAIINRLSPTAQREVERIYLTANTDDPHLANLLVPNEKQGPSRGEEVASVAWGTLIDGKPVAVPETVERVDYVETLLKFLTADIQRLLKLGGSPDIMRIQGLANVVAHISQQVQLIAQDPAAQQKVKIYKDVLGKAQNEIKGFFQRYQEAMKAKQQEGNMDAMAKVQSTIAMTQAQIQAMQAKTAAQIQLDNAKFAADQNRLNAATSADIRRGNAETAAAVKLDTFSALADEQRKDVAMAAEQSRKDRQAESESESDE